MQLTLFQEGRELAKELKVGKTVRIAGAGVDRKAGDAVEGTITSYKPKGNLNEVTISLKSLPREPALAVTGIAKMVDAVTRRNEIQQYHWRVKHS